MVVLTFNSGATIGACLDALALQNYNDFYVIVVDDDSTDETVSIVAGYSSRLRLSVMRNGAHNIPRGRNIGIEAAHTGLVAFVDSDDCAAPGWTQAIVDAAREHPGAALIGGSMLPAYRTSTAHAIALNDDAVRRLFWSNAMRLCAGNCAINRSLVPDARFDEEFHAAEDLDLMARLKDRAGFRYAPAMQVHHYSRETFREYARQMYRYGFMKFCFSFACRSFQWPDFVPLTLFVGGIVAGVALHSWWPLLLNLPFALAEATFVVLYQPCPAGIAPLTFPAWIIKNLAWSYGMVHGLIAIAMDRDSRQILRAKRAGRA